MISRRALAVSAVVVAACASGPASPPAHRLAAAAGSRPAPSSPGVAPPAPAHEGCHLRLSPPGFDLDLPGAAYALVDDGVLRIESAGATLIPATTEWMAILEEGPRGSTWLAEAAGLRVLERGAADLRAAAPPLPFKGARFKQIVPRSLSDVRGLVCFRCSETETDWAVVHWDGRVWTRRDAREFDASTGLGAGPRARGLAASRDGVWLGTSQGIWRASGGSWERVEMPEVEGIEVERIVAAGERLIVERGVHRPTFTVRDPPWREIAAPPENFAHLLAASPSGLVAWRAESVHVGSVDGDCEPRASDISRRRLLLDASIDGSDRVWLATAHGLVVLDRSGETLADYEPGTLPGLTGWVRGVAVPSRGPGQLPPRLVPRRLDVVGQLVGEGTPLVGATVHFTVGAFKAEATTDGDGRFRLVSVPEGTYPFIGVTLPRPAAPGCDHAYTSAIFALKTATQCADDALVDGVCQLGAVPVVCKCSRPPCSAP